MNEGVDFIEGCGGVKVSPDLEVVQERDWSGSGSPPGRRPEGPEETG
jgi:hypothetical protein